MKFWSFNTSPVINKNLGAWQLACIYDCRINFSIPPIQLSSPIFILLATLHFTATPLPSTGLYFFLSMLAQNPVLGEGAALGYALSECSKTAKPCLPKGASQAQLGRGSRTEPAKVAVGPTIPWAIISLIQCNHLYHHHGSFTNSILLSFLNGPGSSL